MLQLGPLKGRPCSVCKHVQAREIATALLAGGSCREVAKRYRIPLSTLARHNRLHLRRIARAEAAIGQPAQTPCKPGSIEAEVVAAPRIRELEAYEVNSRCHAGDARDTCAHIGDRYASRTLGRHGDSVAGAGRVACNLELLARLDGSLGGPATPVGPVSIRIEYAKKDLIGPPEHVRLIEAGE